MPTRSRLDADCAKFLNQAAAAELYASNFYLHASAQLQRLGYFGAAAYFRGESDDERKHYDRIAGFMNDRGSVVTVGAVPAMKEAIGGLRDAVEAAYDTEVQLEEDYTRWYRGCDDPIVQQFLLFYLEEQRVSVGKYGDLLARLDRAGTDACALLLIDAEMKP